MSILNLLGNEKMQKVILGTIIGKFKEQGIKKVLVGYKTITNEKGKQVDELEYEPVDENAVMVSKIKLDFLTQFYETNKHLITDKK